MKHLGDITKISGYDAPIVNVIIGGSPCQDLSVAGKRAGLSGERSGLFMEQIRIIKEMRERDAKAGRTGADIRPRFMVWENVPGAFSVNGGRDFAAVIEETIRVVDKEAPDIQVPCDGWTNSGCFMGNGYSVAWRVLDAQFWGVPQRRRRIALVADFAGGAHPKYCLSAKACQGILNRAKRRGKELPEMLRIALEQQAQSVSLNAQDALGGGKGILIQNEQTGTLSTVQNQSVCYPETARALCARHDSSPCIDRGQEFVCLPINTMVASRGNEECRTTLGIGNDGDAQFTLSKAHEHAVCYGISAYDSNAMKSSNPNSGVYEAETSRTLDNNCGNPACNQGGIAVCQKLTESASK